MVIEDIRDRIGKRTMEYISMFRDHGYELYPVGGCIRDILLGLEPHDIDMCTSAMPQEVIRILKAHGIRYYEYGISHGTVASEDGIEITTFRKESGCDGRHCHVEFADTIEEDLARRDFTINSMAYDVINDMLIDPFNGMSDLLSGTIRTVGHPGNRFLEDELRVLRGLRFAVRYHFEIDEDTHNEMLKHISNGLIDKLSKERIQWELVKIMSIDDLNCRDMELLRPLLFHIVPELSLQYHYDQNNSYHCYDLWEHTVHTVLNTGMHRSLFTAARLSNIRLAALLHDTGKPASRSEGNDGYSHFYGHAGKSSQITETVLRRLKFASQDIEMITSLVRYHSDQFSGTSRKSIQKLIRKVGKENMEAFWILMLSDTEAHDFSKIMSHHSNIINGITTYRQLIRDDALAPENDRLAIDGNDIMTHFSLEPSKEVGDMLAYARQIVDEEICENSKEDLIHHLQLNFKTGSQSSA